MTRHSTQEGFVSFFMTTAKSILGNVEDSLSLAYRLGDGVAISLGCQGNSPAALIMLPQEFLTNWTQNLKKGKF